LPGIGIITNPNSKANKRDPSKSALLGYILGQQGQLAVTNCIEHLHQVAHSFKDSKIEILAINGGDGTISQTLSAFVGAYGSEPLPKIALLRGGTMNVLASNLGIRGTPERLLFHLVERYSASKIPAPISLQSLDVNGRIGFLYADGVAYRVLDEFYRNKSNAFGAILLVLRLAGSSLTQGNLSKKIIKSQDIEIESEGLGRRKISSTMLFVSTIDRMPLGLKLFPHARSSPGRFQVVDVISAPERLLFDLPKIIQKSELGDTDQRISFCSPRLSIKSHDTYNYSVDGELYTSPVNEEVIIKMGPKFEFIGRI
jgi:diacylglycerol kinase family enzyme